MQNLILTLHLIVCFLLVILILLQSGKEGMGVIFGGGNSSVFGSAGAGGILAKLTTLMAVIFIITSLSYTYVTSSKPSSESAILNVHIEEPVTEQTDSSQKEPAIEEKAQEIDKKDASENQIAVPPGEETPAATQSAPETGETRTESVTTPAKQE